MTLKTGEIMLKIQLCTTEVNYILKYIQIEKLFLILTMFYNITVFYCISLSKKKYTLGEHKRLSEM